MGIVVVFYLPVVKIGVEHQSRGLQGFFYLNFILGFSLTLNDTRLLKQVSHKMLIGTIVLDFL